MDTFKKRSVPAKTNSVVIRWLNFRTEELIADDAISGRSLLLIKSRVI
jgi:hypothetical protein